MNKASDPPPRRGSLRESLARRPLVGDALAILLAVFLLAVVGAGGGYLLARLSCPEWIFPEVLPLVYWTWWGGKVVGAFTGQLLAGFVLGRYLRRIRPWHVLVGVFLYMVAVIAVNRGFVHADDGMWIDAVGYLGAVTQMVVQIAAMLAMVSGGIWLGRKQRDHVAQRFADKALTQRG